MRRTWSTGPKGTRFSPDPGNVGSSSKGKGVVRTPQQHREAVAALKLDPAQPAAPKDHRPVFLGKRGFRRALHELGFDSYADYQSSALWITIRSRIMKRAKNRCRDCGGRAVQVHHEAYTLQNLRGEDDRYLAALCDPCHHHRHGLAAP